MKIDELNQKSTLTYVVGGRPDKAESAEAQGDAMAKQQGGSDKVDLSSYMPVVPTSKSPQGVRAARIEELKAQIAEGSYEVSSQAVAEKMISKFALK